MTIHPAFPLGTAFIPGDAVVLRVFEPRYLELVNAVMSAERLFVSALISAGSEVGGGDKRFDSGVLVEIDRIEPTDIGFMLYGHALRAIHIMAWEDHSSFPRAQWREQECHTLSELDRQECLENIRRCASALQDFFSYLEEQDVEPPIPSQMVLSLIPTDVTDISSDSLWQLFWTLCRLLPSTPLSKYQLLREAPLRARLDSLMTEIQHVREIVAFRFGQ